MPLTLQHAMLILMYSRGQEEQAASMFQLVSEAYDVLSDRTYSSAVSGL